jgi:hypothetical protein
MFYKCDVIYFFIFNSTICIVTYSTYLSSKFHFGLVIPHFVSLILSMSSSERPPQSTIDLVGFALFYCTTKLKGLKL